MLRVELVAPSGTTFRCMAIVDSGADVCTFPLVFATALGLDPLTMKKQTTTGVGGNAVAHHENIKIRISFLGADGPNVTTEFDVYACFTASMDSLGLGLLGQVGFFENYPTAFHHGAKVFSIDVPDPTQAAHP